MRDVIVSQKKYPTITSVIHQSVAPRNVRETNGTSFISKIPAGIDMRWRTTGIKRPIKVYILSF